MSVYENGGWGGGLGESSARCRADVSQRDGSWSQERPLPRWRGRAESLGHRGRVWPAFPGSSSVGVAGSPKAFPKTAPLCHVQALNMSIKRQRNGGEPGYHLNYHRSRVEDVAERGGKTGFLTEPGRRKEQNTALWTAFPRVSNPISHPIATGSESRDRKCV